MTDFNEYYLGKHKKFRVDSKKLTAMFVLLALIVCIVVFWWLKLVGITVTSDALCDLNEHTHGDECYITELICGCRNTTYYEELPSGDGTTGKSDSPEKSGSGEEFNSGVHYHSDECYDKTLICDLEEHIHTAGCFPDYNADIESAEDWFLTFENVKYTDSVSHNIYEIAKTQVGYKESQRNFTSDEDGNRKGYTRYGEWYGNPYADWNGMFLSFCLNYSKAENARQLRGIRLETIQLAWQEAGLYKESGKYTPQQGSVIFFDRNDDDVADAAGIVSSCSDSLIIVIEGDVDGEVALVKYRDFSEIMGYGLTEKLEIQSSETESVKDEPVAQVKPETESLLQSQTKEEQEADDTVASAPVLKGQVSTRSLMSSTRADSTIIYTSHLEGELVNAVIKDLEGITITNGSIVYIGESYQVSLEFREINTGSIWTQFRHDADGYLTFQIPSNLECEPFDSWHSITAITESGTAKDVGEYFVDETGLLRVKFYENASGVNFVDRYTNVDFSINFNATVASTQSGSTTEILFNDKISVNVEVDGGAAMDVTKTHGEYNSDDHTMEYTIKAKATHGVVKDLVIDDQIWENHYVLRDTIVVTDLDGNVLDPQPVVTNHPSHNSGAQGGFSISGFPDFAAGNGYLITYKSQVYDDKISGETVDMWNGLDCYAKDSKGSDLYVWTDDWVRVDLEKMEKGGKQTVIQDENGNDISVIEWEIVISKNNTNLQGTVIIDTLGEGLAYYQKKDILVRCFDEAGKRLPDITISWKDVTVNGNTMSFDLPSGYAFDVIYYTTYETLDDGELKNYSNSVKATINGKVEEVTGSADVIGFIPRVVKSASGNDGEYVYFTINADVPAIIKDWGNFFITDLSAFWSYENEAGLLYVENNPEDLVITAVTETGQTVTFTPYVEGGPVENTYILVTPANGQEYHTFNIYFNTSDADKASSKWILDENAVLTISYKIPFDAKTGTQWQGELTGDKTIGDVLAEGKDLANEVYLNYNEVISGVGSTTYDYAPSITKKSIVNSDGTIDYTVVFHNTIPGSYGNKGYLQNADMAYFTDTFDERLEYVEGSFTVTCYDPWRPNMWINKYKYNGEIEGNSMNISATEFVFDSYNYEDAQYDEDGKELWGTWPAGFENYRIYYRSIAGGDHVFTYKLKLKDEYLYTTEHASFQLDNTAELLWDENGSSGPVTETTEYETGLIDKAVMQKDSRLEFDIHINRDALDILEGSDTLTIEDTMTPNLSVYWETIKLLYEDTHGNWIDFDSAESRYNYSVTYDPVNNKLTFVVPDSLHMRIDYTTLITESGKVSVNNAVKIDGKAEVADVVDAVFKVEEHSGDASGSIHKITLLKQDGFTFYPLPGATFLLYGPMGDPDAKLPEGAQRTIRMDDGTLLDYIGTYTTGQDGTSSVETPYLTIGGPYAFVETVAPQGYDILEKPTYFYFYDQDPDGIIQSVTTLVVIENYIYSFILPETGGMGTLHLTIIGTVLMAAPVLYSIICRRRERRLGKATP